MTRKQRKRFKYIAKLCHMSYGEMFKSVNEMQQSLGVSLAYIEEYMLRTVFFMRLAKDYAQLGEADFTDALHVDIQVIVEKLYRKDPLKYWRQYKYVKLL